MMCVEGVSTEIEELLASVLSMPSSEIADVIIYFEQE